VRGCERERHAVSSRGGESISRPVERIKRQKFGLDAFRGPRGVIGVTPSPNERSKGVVVTVCSLFSRSAGRRKADGRSFSSP
jgi:hypothetical protein